MLSNKNEECLLKFVSRANTDNNFIEVISNLGINPHSREYNPVYRIIEELSYCDTFKREMTK